MFMHMLGWDSSGSYLLESGPVYEDEDAKNRAERLERLYLSLIEIFDDFRIPLVYELRLSESYSEFKKMETVGKTITNTNISAYLIDLDMCMDYALSSIKKRSIREEAKGVYLKKLKEADLDFEHSIERLEPIDAEEPD